MARSSHLDADERRHESLLDRWHEIHDAYVAFFGDDHRPAAVACADEWYAKIKLPWTTAPGSIWAVENAMEVQFLERGLAKSAVSKVEWLE